MPRSRSPPPRHREREPDRKYRSRDDKDRRRSRSRNHDRERRWRKESPPPERSRPGAYSPPPRRSSPPRRSGVYTPPRRPSPSKRAGAYSPPPRSPPPKRSGAYSPPPRNASKDLAPRSTSDDHSAPPVEKEKPNFSATGLLAAATNTVNNVVLKYSEPSDSRRPPPVPSYKLFVFKDTAIVEEIDLNPRSCWLIGRDRAVADLPVDHPSCSKQHAVLQFRFVTKVDEFGEKKGSVRLYVMDLESANGTSLNGDEIEGRRFVECREGDLLRFGLSTREYVIMLDRG